MSNFVNNAGKHANIVESIVDSISEIAEEIVGMVSEDVRSSNLSILAAAKMIRRQSSSGRKQCVYLQDRMRNQSSVVSPPTGGPLLAARDKKLTFETSSSSLS